MPGAELLQAGDLVGQRVVGDIAGDEYSIADMACYPWINPYDAAPLDLAPFAEVRRWHAAIAARPATRRAYALSKTINPDAGQPMTDEEKKILFNQPAR